MSQEENGARISTENMTESENLWTIGSGTIKAGRETER